MKASIMNLIAANPSGLLELKPAMSIPEYRDNFGFGLKNVFTIYKSKKISDDGNDWYAFTQKSLEKLLTVQKESSGDLLVVYIIETISNSKVKCNLILSDDAYQIMINDKNLHILQIHQMYTKFFQDHIAINMVS